MSSGKKATAIQLQREYHDLARKYQASHELPSWAPEILDHWVATLDALERDPLSLADRIDWVAKQVMIGAFLDRKSLDWESPQAQMLDLQFHDVLVDSSASPRLQRAMRTLLVETRMCLGALEVTYPDLWAQVREHEELREAIAGEPASRVNALLVAHLDDAVERLAARRTESSPTTP